MVHGAGLLLARVPPESLRMLYRPDEAFPLPSNLWFAEAIERAGHRPLCQKDADDVARRVDVRGRLQLPVEAMAGKPPTS